MASPSRISRFPKPGIGVRFDADAGGGEFGHGLAHHLDALNLELLVEAAEDFLEGTDALDADAGKPVRDEAPDAAP